MPQRSVSESRTAVRRRLVIIKITKIHFFYIIEYPPSVKSVPRPRAAGYGCIYKHRYSIKHFLSKVKICRRRETVLPKRIFQEARSVYFLFRLWDIHRAEQPSSAPSVFMMTSSTSHLPRL